MKSRCQLLPCAGLLRRVPVLAVALACAAMLSPAPAETAAAGQGDKPTAATPSSPHGQSRRATERLQVLQREADALLAQERTLLVDLRRLEVARDIKAQELEAIDAEMAQLAGDIGDAGRQLTLLERARDEQAPALRARLVEVYKLGAGGYLRLLLGVDAARDVGRAYRMVSALTALDRERARAHRSTLAALANVRGDLDRRRAQLETLRGEAAAARDAMDRAVRQRSALVASIDARRDLNAQLMGELQAAQQQLDRTVTGLSPATTAALPLRPFQGALDWPARGAVVSHFGSGRTARYGTAVPKNGIEIAAAQGAPALAIHEGTVAYAAPFTGFGNLVIVDHGRRAYSLYGYLDRIDVAQGARLDKGDRVGVVGAPPAGAAALYFELRVDGRAVDPLQWLKDRP